jgi:prophage antirepressor-like protein
MIEEIKDDNKCIVKAFENNPIAILHEDINNKKVYYFKASDIGKALGIVNIHSTIQNYEDEDERVIRKAYDPQMNLQNTTFLSSHGVYRLLYTSKKEVAKKFRKWAGNILDDIIFNESAELKRQLEQNDKMLLEKETLLQESSKQHQIELQEKDIKHVVDLKLDKHKILLEKFHNKNCIYLCEIQTNLIKIGSSQDINVRKLDLKRVYGSCTFLDIFDGTTSFREIEQHILCKIKDYLYKGLINGHSSKEVILLKTHTLNYNQLLTIVTNEIKNFTNKEIELRKLNNEEKKIDLINKLIDRNLTYEQINKLINYKNENIIIEPLKKSIQNVKNTGTIVKKGRKIQVINPDNLNCIVTVYDSMIFALRDTEHNYDKHSIQNACKKHTIYKEFRWLFVEHGQNPNIVTDIKPTVKSNQPDLDIILQLNSSKTCIIDNYYGITLIKNKFKVSLPRLHKIINNDILFNDSYFVKINNCPVELLNNYKETNDLVIRTNSKSKKVKQINILSNEEITYSSISEASVKFGTTHKSITNCIKNNTNLNGYIWAYV